MDLKLKADRVIASKSYQGVEVEIEGVRDKDLLDLVFEHFSTSDILERIDIDEIKSELKLKDDEDADKL